MPCNTKVTLLFVHGSGFCKDTWDPITRRLSELQMLKDVPTDVVTFDFPYHGDKHDPAALQSFQVDLSNPRAPRVWNDKHDLVQWAAGAVQEQVAAWKKKVKTEDPKGKMEHKLIGVGHSLGAAGLWMTEVAHPGTFEGLILFEPVLAQNSPETDYMIDFLAGLTLQRAATWPSRAAAQEYFYNLRNFAKWDRETLDGYLRGGLVESDDGTVTLACHPNIEASLYCQKPLWLTKHELEQPKCPITFHWGSRSKMWFRDRFESLQSKLPHIYTVRDPMEGNSHVLVLENPALAAENISRDLAELEPYADGKVPPASGTLRVGEYRVGLTKELALSMATSPVLLFAHGAGFCKEMWAPIIRRMKQSSLLRITAGVDFVSLDLPYHGANRDNSEAARVDERGPHVTHPANSTIALGSNLLLEKAKAFGAAGRPVIGVGHSLGAAALWKAEVTSPGTFKGLVLFEPIYGPPTRKGTYNFMADVTLKREWKWDSREDAVAFFENWKGFSSWDRESLASWMQGAVVPDDNDSTAVVLSCHPAIEASIYSGGRLWLSEQEQAKPKCTITFHSGSLTRLYHPAVFEEIAGRNPEIYKIHAPMVDKSHLMVFEDPETCAKAIVSDLAALECFRAADSRL